MATATAMATAAPAFEPSFAEGNGTGTLYDLTAGVVEALAVATSDVAVVIAVCISVGGPLCICTAIFLQSPVSTAAHIGLQLNSRMNPMPAA